MKLFRLFRTEDVSGQSGTGLIAEVVKFSTGKCVVSFLPGKADVTTVTVYDSLDDVVALHGHDDRTRLVPVSLEQFARDHVGAELRSVA